MLGRFVMKKNIFTLISFIALTLCLFVSPFSFAESSFTTNDVTIDNFAKVNHNYYRGSHPKDGGYAELGKLGIKTIIYLNSIDNDTLCKYAKEAALHGIEIHYIEMIPTLPPTEEEINYFFSVVNNVKNYPIYVHCRYGNDRTVIMTALYRVHEYGWGYDEAYAEMKNYGYHSFFCRRLKVFLEDYVESMNGEEKTV